LTGIEGLVLSKGWRV